MLLGRSRSLTRLKGKELTYKSDNTILFRNSLETIFKCNPEITATFENISPIQ